MLRSLVRLMCLPMQAVRIVDELGHTHSPVPVEDVHGSVKPFVNSAPSEGHEFDWFPKVVAEQTDYQGPCPFTDASECYN